MPPAVRAQGGTRIYGVLCAVPSCEAGREGHNGLCPYGRANAVYEMLLLILLIGN
jgi:hypothetical protein